MSDAVSSQTVADQHNNSTPRRLIVGISGASGVVYGITALRLLRQIGVETHVVMSRGAILTMTHETDTTLDEVRALANVWHRHDNLGAAISSGSFPVLGMLVAPCSIKTLSEIALCITGNLLSRAADVTLKERRRLVLMVRETPLHLGHLRNMVTVTESGAIVCPPVPAFYGKPETLQDMVNHSVGRALDLFGLDTGMVKRWNPGPA
jgi:4-hydroxy-3-polyprenylbenzoate decarboxylase